MDIGIDIDALKTTLLPYLQDLKAFNFSFLNPLFWISLFIIFLVFSKFWGGKKSFSFCLIIGMILLATTKVEGYVLGIFGGTFDSFIVRIISIFFISIIFLYYALIKHS